MENDWVDRRITATGFSYRPPRVVVLLGPMGSAKSLSFTSHIYRCSASGLKCLVLKHRLDNRYTKEAKIISHNQAVLVTGGNTTVSYFDSETVRDWIDKNETFWEYDVIGIDEAHLLVIDGREDETLLSRFAEMIVKKLKKSFVLTALDRWFTGKEIRIISRMISDVKPEKLEYLVGICEFCRSENGIFTKKHSKENGNITEKIDREEDHISIGGFETYSTCCRSCFDVIQ